jgi:PAS domain S-box-containing protein
MRLALEAAEKAEELKWTSPAFFEVAEFHFFAALVHAEQARQDAHDFEFHRQKVEQHRRQIAVWQQHCDANFGPRLALLDAEVARLDGHHVEAEDLYELAIRKAREQRFVQIEAIAFESAGRFYLSRNLQLIAQTYLEKARECYDCWGAFGKSRQIEIRYGRSTDRRLSQRPPDTLIASSPHLDLLTVSRMSQAVSSEIVLDRLIETAIRTCVRYAGATRGILWLPTDEQSLVEATTDRDSEEICVKVRHGVASEPGIPERLHRLIVRTREVVIIDDVDRATGHVLERHALAAGPRSVLCMPLVNQARLIGILYLENHLVYSAFTNEHIEVLKLIASQAAISVVNARLYSSLQESERRYELTLSSIGDGVVAMDDQGRITFINGPAEALTGRSNREALGQHQSAVLVVADEETGDVLLDPVSELAGLETQIGWHDRIVIIAKDGTTRPIRLSGSRIQNEDGEITGHVVVISDMTLLRKAGEDLRKSQADLARISRVTTMGEFAASIAHEVNQPLMAIVTNADALIRWLARGEQGHEQAKRSAERIVRDGHRAGDIVRSIRALSNNSQAHFAMIDLNEVVLSTIALVRTELREQNVSVSLNLKRGPVHVMGDRTQLQQVVLNLIINGSEAMSSVVPEQRVLVLESMATPDGDIKVIVDDNGSGVSDADSEQIFSAFFTTKLGGVGMGLSICKSIVDAHGGRIWTESRIPRGSRFVFALPGSAQVSHFHDKNERGDKSAAVGGVG